MFLQIGVSEVAVRRRILSAIVSIHKRKWDIPEVSKCSGNILRYVHIHDIKPVYILNSFVYMIAKKGYSC